MDNDACTTVEEELAIGCGRKMGSEKQICGRQYLSRRLPMIYILMISWSISWVRYTR
jgi:hypothetical protein